MPKQNVQIRVDFEFTIEKDTPEEAIEFIWNQIEREQHWLQFDIPKAVYEYEEIKEIRANPAWVGK